PSPHHTLSFYTYRTPRYPHSFPTRRSSDLRRLGRVHDTGVDRVRPDAMDLLPRGAVVHTPELDRAAPSALELDDHEQLLAVLGADRKSTRLNSSHVAISYAVFCLKKKNKNH